MKLKIKGLTEAIITLNKIGVPLQGTAEAIVNVVSESQENEIKSLVNAGLLEVIDIIKKDDFCSDLISKKSSKNDMERIKSAEDKTQEMGSSVTIGTGQGTIKKRMIKSASDEIIDSERTRESLDAMKKLEEEEKSEETKIDNDKLEVPDKMGNSAVVVTESGETAVNMTISIVPGSEDIKKNDPFVDKSNELNELNEPNEQDKQNKKEEKPKRGRPRKNKPKIVESKKDNIEEIEDIDNTDNISNNNNNDIFVDDTEDDEDLGDAFIEC